MSSNSSNDQVIPLTIKWGKEVIEHELIPSAGVKGFKNELEIKTNVPVDRMKLMAKSKGLWKGILKDDFDLTSIDWNAALQKIGGGGPQNGGGSNKLQCLLMGSAAKMTGPREKTVFLEDLPPEEVAKVQEPSGLVNLGNTCYLNSVVQCLRAVPPLRKALTDFTPAPPSATATNAATTAANAAAAQQQRQRSVLLVHALRDTYRTLDRQTAAVQPMALVQASRMAFPQFAQRGPHGQPMQQDAEEFYSAVMAALAGEFNLDGPHPSANIQTALAASSDGGAGSVSVSPEELGGAKNLIDAVFGMKMKETLTCDENTVTKDAATKDDDKKKDDKNKNDNKTKSDSDKKDTDEDKMEVDKAEDAKAAAAASPDADSALTAAVAVEEPPVVSYDLHRKLVCNIQGGSDASAAVNVSHVSQGIALSLEGKIEKRSEALGRDAVWTRRQRMARCPPVLVVQFGRFYWKATPDSMDHAGVKCKVMKPVAFPAVLDVYDFCVPEIQSALKVRRDAVAKAEEDAINRKLKGQVDDSKKEGDEKKKAEKDDNKKDDDDKMDTTDDSNDAKKSEEKAQEEEEDDVDEEDAAALQAALAMSLEPSDEPAAVPVGPGLPSTFMGMYDLFAVVTHKGRDADGGHYMAWVKSNSQPDKVPKIKDSSVDNEEWFVFDDDEVSSCKTEDILKLSGGGDWHMSYLNFYKAKK